MFLLLKNRDNNQQFFVISFVSNFRKKYFFEVKRYEMSIRFNVVFLT